MHDLASLFLYGGLASSDIGQVMLEINALEAQYLVIDQVALGSSMIGLANSAPGTDIIPPGMDHASDLIVSHLEAASNLNNTLIDVTNSAYRYAVT